jgi:hypothetical protein
MDKTKLSVLSILALNIMTNASIAPFWFISISFSGCTLTSVRLMLTLPALFIILSSLITGLIAGKMPKRILFSLVVPVFGRGYRSRILSDVYRDLVFRIILGFGAYYQYFFNGSHL